MLELRRRKSGLSVYVDGRFAGILWADRVTVEEKGDLGTLVQGFGGFLVFADRYEEVEDEGDAAEAVQAAEGA